MFGVFGVVAKEHRNGGLKPPMDHLCCGRSAHEFKYRLAYVANLVCVMLYDNRVGKGDHRHFRASENSYRFSTLER